MGLLDYLVNLGDWVWGWFDNPENQSKLTAVITALVFIGGAEPFQSSKKGLKRF